LPPKEKYEIRFSSQLGCLRASPPIRPKQGWKNGLARVLFGLLLSPTHSWGSKHAKTRQSHALMTCENQEPSEPKCHSIRKNVRNGPQINKGTRFSMSQLA